MVRGLDVFRKYFTGHADQFVLIGGTAATLAMEDAGLESRATKDLDIVLHIEALNAAFGEVFWKFVEEGRYEIRQTGNTGRPVFYRFQKPADERFPVMLEQERLQVFLGAGKGAVGSIGGGKAKATGKIDITVMQSPSRQGEVNPLVENYGHVIVDECHHVGAVSFDAILKRTKAKYVLGLTATPIRRDGQQPIIFMQCGPIRYTAAKPASAPRDLEVQPRLLYSRIDLPSETGIQDVFRHLANDQNPALDTLMLAMPVSWKGTLQQYAGRLHREHATKTDVRITDVVDTEKWTRWKRRFRFTSIPAFPYPCPPRRSADRRLCTRQRWNARSSASITR